MLHENLLLVLTLRKPTRYSVARTNDLLKEERMKRRKDEKRTGLVTSLRTKHQELEAQLAELRKRKWRQPGAIQRVKQEKLRVKDRLVALQQSTF